ncbi:hypothetical protein TNCV_156701 [Trichonephila clavipes]|nr:hypothetical protein TNCV_156701 [Trichonephila clavipes]
MIRDEIKTRTREGDNILKRFITANESWLYHDSTIKQQSSEWKHPFSSTPKKAKTVKSAGKTVTIIVFDYEEIVYLHTVESALFASRINFVELPSRHYQTLKDFTLFRFHLSCCTESCGFDLNCAKGKLGYAVPNNRLQPNA